MILKATAEWKYLHSIIGVDNVFFLVLLLWAEQPYNLRLKLIDVIRLIFRLKLNTQHCCWTYHSYQSRQLCECFHSTQQQHLTIGFLSRAEANFKILFSFSQQSTNVKLYFKDDFVKLIYQRQPCCVITFLIQSTKVRQN